MIGFRLYFPFISFLPISAVILLKKWILLNLTSTENILLYSSGDEQCFLQENSTLSKCLLRNHADT